MRNIETTKTYIEPDDKKRFLQLLNLNNINAKRAAELLGISEAYLSLILNGKRPLTDKIRKKIFFHFVYKF